VALRIGSKLGRYEIVRKIASGATGEVYCAIDSVLGRRIAIKVLSSHPAITESSNITLEREAKAIAMLTHPNILNIHDFGISDGIPFVVMELLEGITLRELLNKNELSWNRAVEIAKSIVMGLVAAHSKGIVHGDLKPENIFVTDQGLIKILDFGLMRMNPVVQGKDPQFINSNQLDEHVVRGTIPYMSPEQLRCDAVDERTDLFAVGCILYELVTGSQPFEKPEIVETVSSILNQEPDTKLLEEKKCPADVSTLILRCLEKDRDSRFNSAEELSKALQQIKFEPQNSQSSFHSKNGNSKTILGMALSAFVLLVVIFHPFLQSPKVNSLAVLPFVNLSPNSSDQYFADGLTEELISKIARIERLRVISRTSAMQYKNTTKPLNVIGRELGVDVVLESSVQQIDDRIRVVANLVQVSTDRLIWSHTYERNLVDILSLQSELAQSIFSEVSIQLTPEEAAAFAAPPVLPQAYDVYLRGLEQKRQKDYSEASLLKEVSLFSKAIQIDPTFAKAYARLAQAHSSLHSYGFDSRGLHLSSAKESIERALILEPNLPETHIANAYYFYWGFKDYENALKEFEIARQLAPNDTNVIEGIAYVKRRQHKIDEALTLLQKAAQLSPRDLRTAIETANTYKMIRKYKEADAKYELAISLSPDQTDAFWHRSENYVLWDGNTKRARAILEKAPIMDESVETQWFYLDLYDRRYQSAIDRLLKSNRKVFDHATQFYPMSQLIGLCFDLAGKEKMSLRYYSEALEFLESEVKRHPGDSRILISLALVYAGLGRDTDAVRTAELAVALTPFEKDSLLGMFRLVDLAHVYVLTGRFDAAIQKLDFMLSKPCWISLPLLQLDPRWDPIKNTPGFAVLAKRYAPV
jgi:eukaryotic-like serine/threonine-protein kinase